MSAAQIAQPAQDQEEDKKEEEVVPAEVEEIKRDFTVLNIDQIPEIYPDTVKILLFLSAFSVSWREIHEDITVHWCLYSLIYDIPSTCAIVTGEVKQFLFPCLQKNSFLSQIWQSSWPL